MNPRTERIYDLICSCCDDDFKGSYHQLDRYRRGLTVYCSASCSSNKRVTSSDKRYPWKWLGVKHVLDELPYWDSNVDDHLTAGIIG